jgi:hypothetical protein
LKKSEMDKYCVLDLVHRLVHLNRGERG